MSKEAKQDLKRWRKKVKDQGAGSRNTRHGASYTRPLWLTDFSTDEGSEKDCEECGPDKEGAEYEKR